MYCPNCGMQNNEKAAFCRTCGLDLNMIARAMEKHLPLAILEKIDEKLTNPKQTRFYHLVFSALFSITILFAAIYLDRVGYSTDAPFYYIIAASLWASTIWEALIYFRSRSKTKMVLTTNDYVEMNHNLTNNIKTRSKNCRRRATPEESRRNR